MNANEAQARELPAAGLWSLPAFMLLVATAGMPSGYYTLLRWCVCIVAVAAVVVEYRRRDNISIWMVALGLLALLFNPLIPVYLSREQWAPINLGAALFFCFHYLVCRRLVKVARTAVPVETAQSAPVESGAPPPTPGRATASQHPAGRPPKRAPATVEEHADLQTLPARTRLDDYQIVRTLGHGGFGITYLAFDVNLESAVALKEYFYASVSVRQRDGTVTPGSTQRVEDYEWGRARFLQEAQTLSTFDHPNIVGVRRFFEENNTAYIVMDYVEGQSLTDVLKEHGTLTVDQWRPWLEALLDGLEHVHDQDYLHRDIKPDNIVIRGDSDGQSQPVLIDFGSARRATGDRTHTAVYTPRYAPLEQYSATGRQGPFTDIYALAAVSYRVLAGEPPPEASERTDQDELKPLTERLRQPRDPLLMAIDKGLAVHAKDRPQSIAAWRAVMEKKEPAARPPILPVPAPTPLPTPTGGDTGRTSSGRGTQRRRLQIRRLRAEDETSNGNRYLECVTDVGIVAFWGRKDGRPDNISLLLGHDTPFVVAVGVRPSKWEQHDLWVGENEPVSVEGPQEREWDPDLADDDIPF